MKSIADLQVTICSNRKTGLSSIRNSDSLFWTGINSKAWVEDNKINDNHIWETSDKSLAEGVARILDYCLSSNRSIEGSLEISL